ncbi:MAG: hypothetical protein HUU35_17035 [Armatimonadetes bacterium]|nr:hypothetical protein [Armatimonadota bacterium]
MPRTIDLSQMPPPEATCYGCGKAVALDRRARAAGKFRCPLCHADNRVGADGVGHPLKDDERLEQMPEVRCPHCHSTNRLPRTILRAGAYTCFHCRAAAPVPAPLRRRAGIVAPAAITGVVVVCFAIMVWSWGRVSRAIGQLGLWDGTSAIQYDADTSLELLDAEPLPPNHLGSRYQARLRVLNPLAQNATIHVRARVLHQTTLVAERTVSVRRVRPGEWRPVVILIIDPRSRPVDSIRVEIVGVS